jgi:hypothetical protein
MRTRLIAPRGLVRAVSLAAIAVLPALLAACGKGTGTGGY